MRTNEVNISAPVCLALLTLGAWAPMLPSLVLPNPGVPPAGVSLPGMLILTQAPLMLTHAPLRLSRAPEHGVSSALGERERCLGNKICISGRGTPGCGASGHSAGVWTSAAQKRLAPTRLPFVARPVPPPGVSSPNAWCLGADVALMSPY